MIGEAAGPFIEDHGGRRARREAHSHDIDERVNCRWCRSSSVPAFPFVIQENGNGNSRQIFWGDMRFGVSLSRPPPKGDHERLLDNSTAIPALPCRDLLVV